MATVWQRAITWLVNRQHELLRRRPPHADLAPFRRTLQQVRVLKNPMSPGLTKAVEALDDEIVTREATQAAGQGRSDAAAN